LGNGPSSPLSEPIDRQFLTGLEHLAPASQPTPPSVRNPAGAGPSRDPHRFLHSGRRKMPCRNTTENRALHDAMPQFVHFALLNCILGRQ
jgi:hypothetical protein